MEEKNFERKSWAMLVFGSVALYFIVSFAVQLIAGMLGGFIIAGNIQSGAAQSNLINAATLLSSAALILLFRMWLKSDGILFIKGAKAQVFLRNSLAAIAIWFAFLVVEYVIAIFAGDFLNAGAAIEMQTTAYAQGNIILQIISIGIITPIAEEMIFRGSVYAGLRKRFGVPAAAVIAGLIFGAVHAKGYLIVIMTIFGVLLCLVYEKTCNLLYPILMHITNNILNGIILFFPLFGNFIMAMITIIAMGVICWLIFLLGEKNQGSNNLRAAITGISDEESAGKAKTENELE